MKAILIIAIVLALGGYAQAQQKGESEAPPPSKESKVEAHFTAKVEWIEMVGERKADVVLIGFDAHWLVGIEILSVEKPQKRLDKKGKVILLIHSPAMLFPDEEPPGRTYAFTVFGTMREGRAEFYSARAEAKKSPEKKQP